MKAKSRPWITIDYKRKMQWDDRCWVLRETYEGKDRDGNPKEQTWETYWATLRQVANEIIDRGSGECNTLTELLIYLKDAQSVVTGSLSMAAKAGGSDRVH